MSDNKQLLGLTIRTMRESRNMSQVDLAIAIGKKPSAVSNYERGYREPDLDTLEAIADVFNVPMSSFLEQSDAQQESIPLTNAEGELLGIYRSSNEAGREYLMNTARMVADNPAMQKEKGETASA